MGVNFMPQLLEQHGKIFWDQLNKESGWATRAVWMRRETSLPLPRIK
jgi:hypothetical protein